MTDTTQLSNKQSTTPMLPGTPASQQGTPIGRQSVQAAEQAGHASSGALRRAGEITGATAQRAGETGSETMRRSMEAFVDHQHQVVQTAAKQFEEITHKAAEAAQGIAADLGAFMTLPTAADKIGLEDLRQSITDIIEGVVRTNVRATQELLQITNPSGFVELQQRYMREYLDVLMHGTATFFRAMRRTADETLRPVEQQLEQRRQSNQSARAQHAAE
jgi:hypothetical protein